MTTPSVLPSVIDAIGNTPLIRLDRLVAARGLSGTILAKLDYLNPGFSKKDRAAKGLIEDAERKGQLQPGQTVVELTSGNMGTGLAIVCAIKGYPFIAVMSKGNSPERARQMTALGAQVVLVDQLPGSVAGEVCGGDLEAVEKEAQRLTAEHGAFRADQFHREGAWLAHYHGTGAEIWAQSGGALDGFADFAGTGGTYAGVTRALKERNPAIRGYIVEPEGAAAIAGSRVTQPSHPIQGGGYAIATSISCAACRWTGFSPSAAKTRAPPPASWHAWKAYSPVSHRARMWPRPCSFWPARCAAKPSR